MGLNQLTKKKKKLLKQPKAQSTTKKKTHKLFKSAGTRASPESLEEGQKLENHPTHTHTELGRLAGPTAFSFRDKHMLLNPQDSLCVRRQSC